MNLYLLRRRGSIGYDEVAGMVVAADHSSRAVELAGRDCGDEGPQAWLDAKLTILGPVTNTEVLYGVILRDFRAG